MSSLYIDCSLGISGDMLVAALLDAGGDRDALERALGSLSVADEFSIEISEVAKAGVRALDFDVALRPCCEVHDHDMAYLHELGDHLHDHDHDHDHGGEAHDHAHRNLADVMAIVDTADLTRGARDIAARAFEILAQAEARAHGLPVEQVHFHEVGAVDSIVDIVSASVLVDSLAVDAVFATPLADGYGTVRCQHGVIPVPVPAVVNICHACGLPMSHLDVQGELVTPTGAAMVAALGAVSAPDFPYTISATGVGAGKRSYSVPSLLRVHRIDRAACSPCRGDRVVKLECDVDDQSGEGLAHAADALLAEGALEVHWSPIFGKKGRPAYQLQVIVAPQDVERMQRLMFLETTTIGIRRVEMDRSVLERCERTVQTSLGPVRVKTVTLPGGAPRSKPEYEDVARICVSEGLAFPDALARIHYEMDEDKDR